MLSVVIIAQFAFLTPLSVTGSPLGWEGPILIEANDSGDAYSAQVAADDEGNAIAVWHQPDGAYNRIWANRYVNGSGWGVAEIIGTNDTASSSIPQLAMDAAGNAFAIWIQYDGTFINISSNRYVVGVGWGTQDTVATDFRANPNPELAIDNSGNAIAIWSNDTFSIFSNRYVAGGDWTGAELVVTNDTWDTIAPEIAMDDAGNAMAVWIQLNGLYGGVWARRYTVGGGWDAATMITVNSSLRVGSASLFADPSGNAIAAWIQADGTISNAVIARYTVGSGWSAPDLFEMDDSGYASGFRIATGGTGDTLAIWRQFNGTLDRIWVNWYVPGLGWMTPHQIVASETSIFDKPRVAVGGNGVAFAAWLMYDWDNWTLWTADFDPIDGWGLPEEMVTLVEGSPAFPELAMTSEGSTFLVWLQHDGIQQSVWAARHAAPGTPPIPEFGLVTLIALGTVAIFTVVRALRDHKATI